MSATSLTTMASIQDKVRERIQATFMELIPEETFKGLVQTELTKFVNTDLPSLIRDAAKEQMMKLIREELNKPEWQDKWGYSNGTSTNIGSDMTRALLKELAPDLVTAMFGQMAQHIVNNLRSQRGY